jgi:hypothetical protein
MWHRDTSRNVRPGAFAATAARVAALRFRHAVSCSRRSRGHPATAAATAPLFVSAICEWRTGLRVGISRHGHEELAGGALLSRRCSSTASAA